MKFGRRFIACCFVVLALGLVGFGEDTWAAERFEPADNAALYYWRAFQFDQIPSRKESTRTAFDLVLNAREGAFDEETIEYLEKAERYLEHMLRGAEQPYCEWGRQRWPVDIAHLSKGKTLVNLSAGRFRHLVASGKHDEAVDLLIAALRFSQQLDGGDFLIGVLIKNSTSAVLIDAAAAALPDLNRSATEKLARLLDERITSVRSDLAGTFRNDYLFPLSHIKPPEGQFTLTRQQLARLNEVVKETLGTSITLQSRDEIEQFTRQYQEHVTRMAEAMRSSDPGEVERGLRAYAESTAFPGLRVLAGSGAGVAHSEHRTRIRFAMLRAAVAMRLDGDEALSRYSEPNEAGRPFEVRRIFRETFELKSHYRAAYGRPVQLTVGHLDSIHVAAAKGDLPLVEHHLNSGTRVDLTDRSMRTPLHHAAAQGKTAVVKLLLDKGANVNAIVPDPGAPARSFTMDPELAKRYGLVPTTTTTARLISPQDKTAFDLAENAGHTEVAQLLKNRGGKPVAELQINR